MWLFLVFVTLVFGLLAGLYAWTVYQKLEESQIGHPRVAELSSIIHEGAMAFLKKEYSWLAPFVGVVAVLLIAAPGLGLGSAFAFVLGALCSATAGWIGMYVATNSNGRTTYAALSGMPAEKPAPKSAKKSSVDLDKSEAVTEEAPAPEAPKSEGILSVAAGNALEVAFSGGSIVGMVVVGLGLIGLAIAYLFLNDVTALTAFGMGASSIALFARVGGGRNPGG